MRDEAISKELRVVPLMQTVSLRANAEYTIGCFGGCKARRDERTSYMADFAIDAPAESY